MLAQRNGLPDPKDVEGSAEGCCFLKPPPLPSPGGCPWAWLAGLDGCPSEPYCLWFQLLARAYWGELELGLSGADGCGCGSGSGVSWPWLRNTARRGRVRPWVRRRRSVLVRGDTAGSSASLENLRRDQKLFSPARGILSASSVLLFPVFLCQYCCMWIERVSFVPICPCLCVVCCFMQLVFARHSLLRSV